MNEKIPVKLLYVEDDPAIREAVQMYLELSCDEVVTAADGVAALEQYRVHRPDLVVTDILMPRMDGMELISRLHKVDQELPVLITTAFSESNHLLRAIELGVRGFIRKPLDYQELNAAIRAATLPLVQQRELARLRNDRAESFFQANGSQYRRVCQQIGQVAEAEYSVLIHGEAGTGKTRAARAIHALSPRGRRPFLPVSCRGSSAERLELELFGRERGALGALAAADGGTLLLHEVSEAPLQTQAKLVSFLEEGKSYRCGGKITRADVRLLASLTGEPRRMVEEGKLLEGLFYLLSDLTIRMPSLREMPEELAPLARAFLAEGAEDAGRRVPRLGEDALKVLAKGKWPGNVRELKHIMRRAVLQADREIGESTLLPLMRAGASAAVSVGEIPPSLSLEELERWAVGQALQITSGRKLQAASLLGIDYKRLQRKIVRYGLGQ
ncbi:MAG TPA: sigma-54 dependent transcriptional regulator [Geomonas sp.]|nr:sigma-54 dependent transcriptional regulator [Geomonas sp.]